MDSPMDKDVPHWMASWWLYSRKITHTVVLTIGAQHALDRTKQCVDPRAGPNYPQ